MFNRGVFSNVMGPGSAGMLLVALAIMVLAVPSSLSHPAASLSVTVESVSGAQTGEPFSVGINLENDSARQIGGFDLLLAYDAELASLVGVQQGQMLIDCAWEYFIYQTGPFAGCGNDCPSGLVRIVALAEINSGSPHPSCFAEQGGQLASLEFIATADSSSGCQFNPVRFYWLDCGDNALASAVWGDTLYVSHDVFVEDSVPAPPPSDSFPNYSGVPDTCLGALPGAILREVDFYGNGAEIDCPDTLLDADRLRVKVERVLGVQLGQPFTIGINLENDSAMQIGGFDFLLAYDANLATLTGVQQGQLLTDCEWEYFIYRTGPFDSCNGDCPSGLVRLVAVADINNGSPHPSCFAEPGGELAFLEFIATSDSSQECQWNPVRFFWLDCGDNVVATVTGDSLYVSDSVFLDDWFPPPPPVDTFPNYTGTPEHCLDSSQGGISRRINFWGGGADIQCEDNIDERGDINLNGIAFEVADWVLFTNYFVYGIMAFTVNPEAQIAASDCNADGLTLTVADLVYLGRVIAGDSLPYPYPPMPNRSADTVLVIQDTLAHTISIDFADSLSALHLIFAGEVVPDLNLPDHIYGWAFDSTVTRVLAAPDLFDTLPGLPLIDSGLFFSYTGDGQLIAADAAYDGLSVIPTIIYGSSFPDCCVLRGNINGDGQIDITDLTYAVDYLFVGGPPPDCMLEANVDGQGVLMDVADLVYLVDYLFQGGPPPVPCP